LDKINVNNFDFLRIVFALTVALSHLIELSEQGILEPFKIYFNARLSIDGFFIVSGFLIAKSYENSTSTKDYIIRRAKRIIPAYAVVILASAFLFSFISVNSFNDYFSKMPWKSLPFDNEKSEKLSEFFSVQGIPSLVLVDNEGNLLTSKGQELVQNNSDMLELIVNKKYNYLLIEKTAELIKGQGDGRISADDVVKLIDILDNKKIATNDYKTVFYILHNYRFTDPAINILLSYLE